MDRFKWFETGLKIDLNNLRTYFETNEKCLGRELKDFNVLLESELEDYPKMKNGKYMIFILMKTGSYQKYCHRFIVSHFFYYYIIS